MSEIILTTNPCIVCQKESKLSVSRDAYNRWKNGEMIQQAFPELTPGETELLITGTHDECWNSMFADSEYDL